MQRDWLNNNRLRIWLSEEETQRCGVSFDGADAPLLKARLAQMIAEIYKHDHRPLPRVRGQFWQIEAFPVAGGCVLLCTIKTIRVHTRRPAGPFVFRAADIEPFYAMARHAGAHVNLPSALYAVEDGYALIVDCDRLPNVLREADLPAISGRVAAAAVMEHGRPLLKATALAVLAKTY